MCGIRNKRIQDRLLREPKLDLTKAMEICKAAERTDAHIKQLVERTETIAVEEIKVTQHDKGQRKYVLARPATSGEKKVQKGWQRRNDHKTEDNRHQSTTERSKEPTGGNCERCGFTHGRRCPAYGQKCSKCKSNS